jgi:hypothetical protein
VKRSPPFRYSDQEWAPFSYSPREWAKVEVRLAKLPPMAPDAAADARSEIERIVGEYLIMVAGADPRSPDVIATNARWAKVAKYALALNAAIKEMKSLDALGLLLLETAVSKNRKKQPSAFLIWESQCAKVASLAARQASPANLRRFKGGNRSRGHWVHLLLAHLFEFWASRGGRVGKGAKSPSTLFVEAAASRALAETAPAVKLPRAIVDFAGKKNRTIRAPKEIF